MIFTQPGGGTGISPFFELPWTCSPAVQKAGGNHVVKSGESCGAFPEFREEGDAWRPLPSWAQFFLRAGYQLQSTLSGTRRIILLTTPCESAGAALLTLGAMRFRLSQEGADDLAAHFSRIQALSGTRHADRPLCDIRSHGRRAGPFLIGSVEPDTGVWVRHTSIESDRRLITPATAMHWRFQNEPQLHLQHGAQVPYRELYDGLLPNAGAICAGNLSRSDSAICLMTRLRGESATRSAAADIRLSAGGVEAGLDELLTVRHWAAERISRVVLFNTRKGEFDRHCRSPDLVVADGDEAFLRALNEQQMKQADVIGVVPRTLERDRLEAIGHRLAQLEQWYRRDDPLPADIGDLPAGIAAASFAQRKN